MLWEGVCQPGGRCGGESRIADRARPRAGARDRGPAGAAQRSGRHIGGSIICVFSAVGSTVCAKVYGQASGMFTAFHGTRARGTLAVMVETCRKKASLTVNLVFIVNNLNVKVVVLF